MHATAIRQFLAFTFIARSWSLLPDKTQLSREGCQHLFFGIGVALQVGRSGNDGQLDGEFGFAGYGFE
jgi:hypothetical protein